MVHLRHGVTSPVREELDGSMQVKIRNFCSLLVLWALLGSLPTARVPAAVSALLGKKHGLARLAGYRYVFPGILACFLGSVWRIRGRWALGAAEMASLAMGMATTTDDRQQKAILDARLLVPEELQMPWRNAIPDVTARELA